MLDDASDPPWLGIRDRGALAVVLVRHGRTPWNDQQRFAGRSDVPLDDVGHAQARALAEALGLRFDRLFCSPLSRARQTAAALAPPEPEILADLRELDQGELEGLQRDEAIARWPSFFEAWARDPECARVPGGETLGEGRDRGLAAIHEAIARHGDRGIIGVVAHQLILASVLATIGGDRLTEWRRYGLPNAGIAVLSWDGARLSIAAERWTAIAGGSPARDV